MSQQVSDARQVKGSKFAQNALDLDCRSILLAFIYFKNGTFPLGFYGDIPHITEVAKTGFLMATSVIGDALIDDHFPDSSSMDSCGAAVTYQFTQYKPDQNVFLSEAGCSVTTDSVFTWWYLFTKGPVFTAPASFPVELHPSLISWRLWNQSHGIQPYGGGPSLISVLSIIIESAALYTAWGIIFFVAYQSRSNLQFVAVDCWPTITGISCMLIHVRVELGWAQTGSTLTRTSANLGSAQPQFAFNITRAVDHGGLPAGSLEYQPADSFQFVSLDNLSGCAVVLPLPLTMPQLSSLYKRPSMVLVSGNVCTARTWASRDKAVTYESSNKLSCRALLESAVRTHYFEASAAVSDPSRRVPGKRKEQFVGSERDMTNSAHSPSF
ncbi:hypothetical protein DFH08DRAFT_816917 [Mycena albidolilacea]|uniref:Uncharacterized protein n=1 Tax=Mycena albidolilacea TaxID=1033008 RepID=A0AAD7EIV7_9AGAR|nr:hypothetical protein DFH08DRAFT_816917 [Mycena albidolilacea]